MKRLLNGLVLVIACAGPFSISYAEETSAQPAAHEEHHSEATTQDEKNEEKMGMMDECEGMHKDGKMCDHKMKEKCTEHMSQAECDKMMKNMKEKHKNKMKK